MLVLDCSAEARREGTSVRRVASSAAEWVAVRSGVVSVVSRMLVEESGAEGGAGGGVDEGGVVEGRDDGVG